MKKIFWLTIIFVVGAVFVIRYINQHYSPTSLPEEQQQNPEQNSTSNSSTNSGSTGSTSTPKTSLLLSVPFTPQAPTANWDTIHNEDCEEASAVMANAFYNGPHDTKLNTDYVEGQLTKLTDWEMQKFGYNLDISSEETVQLIKANYSLNAEMVTDFNENTIKQYLQENKLVLIPENGQLIGNPNYKAPGPKYHMLVIRGYTSSSIITNDPGTRNGLNYSYSYNTLYNANGDWSHQSNSVDLSKKNIIVVWQ